MADDNNFDEFDPEQEGGSETQASSSAQGKPLAKIMGAINERPIFKLLILMVVVGAIVAASIGLFSEGRNDSNISTLITPPEIKEAAGGKSSAFFNQQTHAANVERANEALQSGGSALPTPVGKVGEEAGAKQDPLKELKAEIAAPSSGSSLQCAQFLASPEGITCLESATPQQCLTGAAADQAQKCQQCLAWLDSPEGQAWLLSPEGQKWLKGAAGQKWLKSAAGQKWLATPDGQKWLVSADGMNWSAGQQCKSCFMGPDPGKCLEGPDGQKCRDWLNSPEGRAWLASPEGQKWLASDAGKKWLASPDGQKWLSSTAGKTFNSAQQCKQCLATNTPEQCMRTPECLDWLNTDEGRAWLNSPAGQKWLQSPDGQRWLASEAGKKWLASADGQKYLAMKQALDAAVKKAIEGLRTQQQVGANGQPRQPGDDQTAQAMQKQLGQLMDGWTSRGVKTIKIAGEEKLAEGAAAGATSSASAFGASSGTSAGASSSAGASAGGALASKILIPAGALGYAQMLVEANSDVQGPIVAQILSGPLSGAKAIGKFEVKADYLVMTFNLASVNGKEYPINAVALDPATTLGGLATDVDKRYFDRLVLPAAASFVSALGQAISQSGSQVSSSTGVTVVSQPGQTLTQGLYAGFGAAGQAAADFFKADANSKQPLIRVRVGTPMALFFQSSVREAADGSGGVAPPAAASATPASPWANLPAGYPFGVPGAYNPYANNPNNNNNANVPYPPSNQGQNPFGRNLSIYGSSIPNGGGGR